MLDKIISKFSPFVIFAILLMLTSSGCNPTASQTGGKNSKNKSNSASGFEEPEEAARIRSKDVSESSGLAVSRCNPGVFWTHNDSENGNMIFAFGSKGEDLGSWRVSGAVNNDWEDIATSKDQNGDCYLYIGDIGNNSRSRGQLTIYKVKEPKVGDKTGTSITEKATAITFSYPDSRHDAESLAVHPKTGALYVITKRYSGAAGVYEIAEQTKTAKKVGSIDVPSMPNGLLTGADISSDGRHLVVCDYFGGYEFSLPANSKVFGDIWKQKPVVIDLGIRKQGEAVAYGPDGNTVYATSEKRNAPLIRVRRKSEQ